MIDGFKLTVSGEELRAHLVHRAKHHAERANWHGKQSGQEDESRHERHLSSMFNFYAHHVLREERYQLSSAEVAGLEFVDSGAQPGGGS